MFLFALWIVLNGRVTIELVIFGVVITSAVTFANRVTGYSVSIERRVLRRFSGFFAVYFESDLGDPCVPFKMCGMVYWADPLIR